VTSVPADRIRRLNDAPIQQDSDYVLYWMIANRRASWNYSLDRAIELSIEQGKPLVVLEAIRSGYEWASDRVHRFVLQGMADNRKAFQGSPVRYYAYVEPEHGQGAGLVEKLAERAAVVVTDDFPCFFLPRMSSQLAERLPVAMETVDSNGILPMRKTDRVFARAHDFRRWLQKNLSPHLSEFPTAEPLTHSALAPRVELPSEIYERWPEATDELLNADIDQLAQLPIDHAVGPAAFDGGTAAAVKTLDRFFESRFSRYADSRNDPEDEAASGLSPYLHFGNISTHEVFDRIVKREQWSLDSIGESTKGAREGWWGMSSEAESFLDELITWRELGYNMCWQRDDYHRYESLPDWAKNSLARHASDPREFIYCSEEFEAAETHDPLWNAAQRQLVRDGRMHNYLRMLWGKKILEWSPAPQDALATMIHLNNKYAVDGRNPNSYSGIFWVLGRYDRAWGPERPIFGKIRYMSSANTARKLRVKSYLKAYGQLASSQKTLFES
jgi:deoxyribodipyrimidine photo-lyase